MISQEMSIWDQCIDQTDQWDGIMVFAKTSKAAGRLSEQVRNKVFKKQYLAVVDGKIDKDKRSSRRLPI